MKTFNEAWKEVAQASKSPVLLQDLLDGHSAIENEGFALVVEAASCDLLKHTIAPLLAGTKSPIDIMAGTCAILHSIFSLGLLVGQRMARPDLEELVK